MDAPSSRRSDSAGKVMDTEIRQERWTRRARATTIMIQL